MIIYKICTKCGNKFPATLEFFHKNKKGKFGLRVDCKICNNKIGQEWHKNNKDKIAIRVAEYRRNNKEKCAAQNAKYFRDNPERYAINRVKRRTNKLNQSPVLTESEKNQMVLIYKKRKELGPDWHVDHIIPVSKGGLFHPDNLQIVLKIYNLQKGAKLNFRLPNDDEIFNWKE